MTKLTQKLGIEFIKKVTQRWTKLNLFNDI